MTKAQTKISRRLEVRQREFDSVLSKQGNSKLHFIRPGSRKK